jgi:hypothetical protein
MAIPMHRTSATDRFFLALHKAVENAHMAAAMKIAHDADKLEARFGEDSIERVRDRILRANRGARRALYRLHDELARRRTPAAPNVPMDLLGA